MNEVCRTSGKQALGPMNSPQASTDSKRERGIPYAVQEIELKRQSSITRIQVTYDDGRKEIVKDPSRSKFGELLLSEGSHEAERAAAKRSLRQFSRFLVNKNVQVSHGLRCWNQYCAGLHCGINVPNGLLFAPSSDFEWYGNIEHSPDEHGNYRVHFSHAIYKKGKLTNRIKLRYGYRYIIGGLSEASTPFNNNVSSHRDRPCECEQCTEAGLSRDLKEVIINPLEVLSQRYQTTQVAGLGMWRPTSKALVRRDRDGTYRIKCYASADFYSQFVCEGCKLVGKIARCGNLCMEMFCGSKDAPGLDIVEVGSDAVVGTILEFCQVKFKKVRKGLRQVTERLDVLGVQQGGPVLSKIAGLVGASKAEVVFVLNNDTSLVQPIISGSNCFLRRDTRGRWNSSDSLTGSELNTQVFCIDPTGTWIMIGSGEKYGVSCTGGGIYQLELGGQKMEYSPHLDSELFGRPITPWVKWYTTNRIRFVDR